MCHYPYSNRDVFDFWDECYVYVPINNFLMSLVFVSGVILCVGGLHQLWTQRRWEIPLIATIEGFCFSLTYIILLATQTTFADRHLGVNILSGLSRGFIWVSMNSKAFRHLEVIAAIDAHTVAKSRDMHRTLMKLNRFLTILSVCAELVAFIVPTVIPSIDFYATVIWMTMSVGWVNIIPRVLFTYHLKKIIFSNPDAERNSFYQPIKKQLDAAFYGIALSLATMVPLYLCFLYVPVLRHNLWICYNLQILTAPVSATIALAAIRAKSNTEAPKKESGEKGSSGGSKKTTRQESEQSSKKQPTSGGSPTEQRSRVERVGVNGTIGATGAEEQPLIGTAVGIGNTVLQASLEASGGENREPQGVQGEISIANGEEADQLESPSSLTGPTLWNPFTVAPPSNAGGLISDLALSSSVSGFEQSS